MRRRIRGFRLGVWWFGLGVWDLRLEGGSSGVHTWGIEFGVADLGFGVSDPILDAWDSGHQTWGLVVWTWGGGT